MTTRMSRSETTGVPGGEPRRPRSRVLGVAVAALIIVVAAAVALTITSDDGSDVARIPSNGGTPTSVGSTAPATTLDARGTAKAAVIDAYKKSYEGLLAVGRSASPDPNDPRLTQYSTGPALIAKQRVLADHKAKGQVYVGDVELHPTVIDLTADTATVVDCSIDRTALIDGRTGSTVVAAGTGGGMAATAMLKLEAGVWKVSDFKAENRSCVPPAA